MVIILNGTSSSGKSSIVEKICDLSDDLYCPFSSDQIVCGSLSHKIDFENAEHFKIIDSSYAAFRKSLKIFSTHIPNIILDDVLSNKESVNEVVNSFAGVPTFFVQVFAPLDIIERRESIRKDRKAGTARKQYDFINSLTYDFMVDTAQLSPEECAKNILENLRAGTAIKALSNYILTI